MSASLNAWTKEPILTSLGTRVESAEIAIAEELMIKAAAMKQAIIRFMKVLLSFERSIFAGKADLLLLT